MGGFRQIIRVISCNSNNRRILPQHNLLQLIHMIPVKHSRRNPLLYRQRGAAAGRFADDGAGCHDPCRAEGDMCGTNVTARKHHIANIT